MNSTKIETWSDYLKQADEARIAGDTATAKRNFESALWKAEQHGAFSDAVFQTPDQMATFYASSGAGDPKLMECCTRLLHMGTRQWGDRDGRLLKYMDFMRAALQRAYKLEPLEKLLRLTLSVEEAASGKGSDAYNKRLDQLSSFLTEQNRDEEARELKRVHRESLAVAPKAPEAEPKATGEHGVPLMAERKVFVGQIINRSGVVKPDEFSKQLAFSKKIGVQIGETLVSSGLMTSPQVDAALKLQKMTRNDEMTLDQAASVLATFCKEEMTFDEAMKRNGFGVQEDGPVDFGQLLVGAELLSGPELQTLSSESTDKQIPLAKHLVVSGKLSATIVGTALDVHERLEAKEINREAAIKELSALRRPS